jgi:hypothetical protein
LLVSPCGFAALAVLLSILSALILLLPLLHAAANAAVKMSITVLNFIKVVVQI